MNNNDPFEALPGDPWAIWLGSRERRPLQLPAFRRAAVLVALTHEPDPRILLTIRSSDMPTHQGQIAFPGGSVQAGESMTVCALREAQEEVHLDPNAVDVLGELDDVFTPVGFHVTPVLARIPPQELAHLKLSREVAAILTPTVDELRSLPLVQETRQWPDGTEYPLYRYLWKGHDIWGMTARVLHDLLTQGPS